MADTYDVIVIGGGAAATSAALTLLNRGKGCMLYKGRSA